MTFSHWDTSGDEPVYASRLNGGALWFADDIADLKTTDTTDLPNNAKVHVEDTGSGPAMYLFNKTATDTVDDFNIVAPTTGGGRYFINLPGTSIVESTVAGLSGSGEGGGFGPSNIADIGPGGMNELEFFRIFEGTVSVGTIAAQSVEDHTLTIPGVRPGDIVSMTYSGPLADPTDCMVGAPHADTDSVTIPFMNTSGTTSADLGDIDITLKIERYRYNGD